MSYEDDSMAVGRPDSIGLNDKRHGELTWIDGRVLTRQGIVDVYSQEDYTRLDFVWNGRLYMRVWRSGLTKRGIVMQAKRFAAEMAQEEST